MTTDSENEFKPRSKLATLARNAFPGPSYGSRIDRLTTSITLAGEAADGALRRANREAASLPEDEARDRVNDIEEYRATLRNIALRLTGEPLSHTEIERIQSDVDAMPDAVRAVHGRKTSQEEPKPCLST